jgi:hypothetical protein
VQWLQQGGGVDARQISLALGACTATYQQRDTGGIEASSIRLNPAKNIFVAIPADGRYSSKPYAGTGQLVAQKTAAAFSRYAPRVEIASPASASREEFLAAARRAGAGYLVIPTIAHWEQRATEWSGIPSRVSLGLAIIDVETGLEVRSMLLESQSATVTLVRPNPEALAQHLIDANVADLYGAKTVPGQ